MEKRDCDLQEVIRTMSLRKGLCLSQACPLPQGLVLTLTWGFCLGSLVGVFSVGLGQYLLLHFESNPEACPLPFCLILSHLSL